MSTQFNSIAIVNVVSWNSKEADKNGEMPILLKALAGKSINKSILAGTIAKSSGFELNKSYMVQIAEGKPSDEYGRQFNFTNLGEVSGLELIKAIKELGNPVIANVTETVVEDAFTSDKAIPATQA